jgi:hypothetical protein
MSENNMSENNAVFGELAKLLGGKITYIVNDGNEDIDERFFGLQIEFGVGRNRKKKILWLLSDFEGNAPGGFDIEDAK